MEGLIDLIFSNPFLLILLIGGLYSLFKRKTEQPESEKEPGRSRPTPVDIPRGPQPERRQQSRTEPQPQRGQYSNNQSQTEKRQPVREKIEVETIAEHKQQQLNDLKKRLNANNGTNRNREVVVADRIRKQEINKPVSKYDAKLYKRHFKENVTSTGLINSVIMSEVLGPPRAMKPYEGLRFKRKYRR